MVHERELLQSHVVSTANVRGVIMLDFRGDFVFVLPKLVPKRNENARPKRDHKACEDSKIVVRRVAVNAQVGAKDFLVRWSDAFTDCLQNHRECVGHEEEDNIERYRQICRTKFGRIVLARVHGRFAASGAPAEPTREVSQAHRQYQDEARDGVDEYEVHVVIELDLRYQASDGTDPCKVEEIREDYCDRTKRIRERDTSDPADMGDDHRRDVRALEHRGRSNADVAGGTDQTRHPLGEHQIYVRGAERHEDRGTSGEVAVRFPRIARLAFIVFIVVLRFAARTPVVGARTDVPSSPSFF